MENKLLEIWEESTGVKWQDWVQTSQYDVDDRWMNQIDQVIASGMSRENLLTMSPTSTFLDERRHTYSWAIPTPDAIRFIARYSPIVEIGAGTGYWAALLRDEGVIVHAYDKTPPFGGDENYWARGATQWTKVEMGTEIAAGWHPAATLLLCWPPLDDTAYKALKLYTGNRVIYVGEFGGCTADDLFHEELELNWIEKATLQIPQWLGLHDRLMMYERKLPAL